MDDPKLCRHITTRFGRASENLGAAFCGHTPSRGPAPTACLKDDRCATMPGVAPCQFLVGRGKEFKPGGVQKAVEPCITT